MKHHHRTGYLSAAIVDWRGRILDGGLKAVAPDQDAVRREAHALVLPHCQCHGIGRGGTRAGIDDAEHVLNRATRRFLARPAGHGFGDRIQIGHAAGKVAAHDRIADGVERELSALPFLEQRLGDRCALDHAAEHLRQQIEVQTLLQQIILRSMLHRQLGDSLILRAAQDQEGDLGRGAKQPVEGRHAVAVGQ